MIRCIWFLFVCFVLFVHFTDNLLSNGDNPDSVKLMIDVTFSVSNYPCRKDLLFKEFQSFEGKTYEISWHRFLKWFSDSDNFLRVVSYSLILHNYLQSDLWNSLGI
ncbi:hypothetical protein Droror1_Dr00004445 [Drosera rotundifolia]